MKIISKILTTVLIIATTATFAQKFGHVNSNELLKSMPGRDSAQTKLMVYSQEIEKQFQVMQGEFETKYNDFIASQNEMTDLIKEMKTKELEDLQARIQEFQASAQEDIQNKEAELLQPIIDKAKKAIEDVAAENKYTYIFDSGVGVLLYSTPSDDILPMVKEKLDIQ